MSYNLQFNKARNSRVVQEWFLDVGEPIVIMSKKEQRYINRRIDIRKFNQPKTHWFRELIGKFKLKFSPAIGKFVNEKNGKVIDTMDLQEEFDAHFYVDEVLLSRQVLMEK